MSHPRPTSMRLAAAAGSLALAFSALTAPAVFAQDDTPEAAINNLVEAIEAKDFAALPGFFCPDFAGDMGGLDLGSMTEGMPEGVDVQTLLDAFIIDVEVNSLDVVSQTDTEAVVDLAGAMMLDIDTEKAGAFVTELLTSMGEEVTPDMIEMFTGMILSEFQAESTDISAQLTLEAGPDGGWLVCSELGGMMDDMSADATDDMSADTTDDMSADATDDMSDDMADESPAASE